MKRLACLIAVLCLCSGCEGDEVSRPPNGAWRQWYSTSVVRYIDKENGNVVYLADKVGQGIAIAVAPLPPSK